jgi:hypothetical protein
MMSEPDSVHCLLKAMKAATDDKQVATFTLLIMCVAPLCNGSVAPVLLFLTLAFCESSHAHEMACVHIVY